MSHTLCTRPNGNDRHVKKPTPWTDQSLGLVSPLSPTHFSPESPVLVAFRCFTEKKATMTKYATPTTPATSVPRKEEGFENHDTVRDRRRIGVAGKLQPQASIDHAHDDDDTTEPEVGESVESAVTGAFVDGVVEEPEDGLEDEETDQDDADGGVTVGWVPLLGDVSS